MLNPASRLGPMPPSGCGSSAGHTVRQIVDTGVQQEKSPAQRDNRNRAHRMEVPVLRSTHRRGRGTGERHDQSGRRDRSSLTETGRPERRIQSANAAPPIPQPAAMNPRRGSPIHAMGSPEINRLTTPKA